MNKHAIIAAGTVPLLHSMSRSDQPDVQQACWGNYAAAIGLLGYHHQSRLYCYVYR